MSKSLLTYLLTDHKALMSSLVYGYIKLLKSKKKRDDLKIFVIVVYFTSTVTVSCLMHNFSNVG